MKGFRAKTPFEIGLAWFDAFNTLSTAAQQELKREMKGRTLVAEFVTEQNGSLVMKYSRTKLIFYTIVEHASAEPCLPFDRGLAFFRKFGLTHVPVEKLGTYSSQEELFAGLH